MKVFEVTGAVDVDVDDRSVVWPLSALVLQVTLMDTRTNHDNFIDETHRWKGATSAFAFQDVSAIRYPYPSKIINNSREMTLHFSSISTSCCAL